MIDLNVTKKHKLKRIVSAILVQKALYLMLSNKFVSSLIVLEKCTLTGTKDNAMTA